MEDEGDVAEQPRVAHLVGSPLQHLVLGRVLASDVDEDVFRPDRVRRDQASLDEPVRNPAHDLPVLERSRLGLVGIGHDVRRLASHLRRLDEAELAPHREACAAPAAKGRSRDLLDHLLARHARAPSRALRSRRSPGTRRAASGRGRRRPRGREPEPQPPFSSPTIPGTSSGRVGSRYRWSITTTGA